MSDAKAPPKIFDTKLLQLRRLRAWRRPESFLLKRCIADAADRLMDVNRTFEKVLILGAESLGQDLCAELPPEKIGIIRIVETLDNLPADTDFDLIISLLQLQSENDLPGVIIQLRQRLKADGLFIAAMFGGETLTELRHVFYKTDEHIFVGLAPHIYPMADYSQAAALLGQAGLNQPVVDMDRITVSYSALDRLISDLRDLGETNVLISRQDKIITKRYWAALKKNYANMFSRKDGKLRCSFEILWLTGWAPHESQQKPLKPGSATISLKLGLKRASKARR